MKTEKARKATKRLKKGKKLEATKTLRQTFADTIASNPVAPGS